MFTKRVKNLSIAYRLSGNGSPLVLLHGGFNCNSSVWEPQSKSLQQSFTLLAWDAPGAGMSDETPENFNINDWADCLAGLLDSLEIKQAHILGLSWGGLLAQVFYLRHSNYVLSLILCDTYTGWIGSLGESEAKARLTAALHDTSMPPQEFVSKYLPSMFADSTPQNVRDKLAKILSSNFHPVGFRMMIRTMLTDTRPLLTKIKVPTLLIWGEEDKRSPPKVAYQFHDAIPGSTLEIISNAGHLSNMENSESFNKVVKNFCLSVQAEK